MASRGGVQRFLSGLAARAPATGHESSAARQSLTGSITVHRLRFLVAVASLILALTSTLTMRLSAAKAIDMVRLLLAGGGKSDQTLVVRLNVVDLILIATVQVIIALGLWELFVDDLDLPDWLTVHSLSDPLSVRLS